MPRLIPVVAVGLWFTACGPGARGTSESESASGSGSTSETSTATAGTPTSSSTSEGTSLPGSDSAEPYSDTDTHPWCNCQIGAQRECEECGKIGVQTCDWYDADACDYGPCEVDDCDENQCDELDPCPAGQQCAEGHCEPLTPIPICERQAMTLSEVALAGAPSAVALADFDGDGALDLLAALPAEQAVELMLGDGAGGFAAGETFPTGMSPAAARVAVADLNEDGRPDVVLTAPSKVGELSLIVNQGGVFAPPLVTTLGEQPQRPFLGDFDGDGHVDVLAHSKLVAGELAFRAGDGMGGVGPEFLLDEPGDVVFALGAGALAGDARVDIVSSAVEPPGAKILELTGDTLTTVGTAVGDGEVAYRAVSVGDLDGEGTDDIVLHRAASDLRMVRAWTQLVASEELALPWAGQIGPIADVDGDGRGELLVAVVDLAVAAVYFDTPCAQVWPVPDQTNEDGLASGDIDGDGKADLVAMAVGWPRAAVLRTGP